jgi:hypothetical protein
MYNFRENHSPPIDDNEIMELKLNDADHIDEAINIESVITTLQYLKDRYIKNDKYHITINSCLRGPVMSWMDHQRNHAEMMESLEQDIIEEEE